MSTVKQIDVLFKSETLKIILKGHLAEVIGVGKSPAKWLTWRQYIKVCQIELKFCPY